MSRLKPQFIHWSQVNATSAELLKESGRIGQILCLSLKAIGLVDQNVAQAVIGPHFQMI